MKDENDIVEKIEEMEHLAILCADRLADRLSEIITQIMPTLKALEALMVEENNKKEDDRTE